MKNKSETEVLDFNNPAYKFVPKGRHEWRQRGYYLVCLSCELQHAVFIGPDKLMVGINKDGMPKLVRRDKYEKQAKRLHRNKKNL